jgi:pimeloyl-ACP methyl ester carboxylesterase
MRILRSGAPASSRRIEDDVNRVDTLTATSSDGTVIGCELLGQGPPLLAVHGSTADRNRWAAVRDALATSFRLHLMDRRGRGLSSEEVAEGYALGREAEDVRAVVKAMGEPVLVLAHSYGGACALEAATDCEGIERMLVYEPALGTRDGAVFPDDALADVDAALARGDREAALTIFFRRVLLLDEPAVGAIRATPMWQARLAAVHTLAREAREANAYRADPERLRSLRVPVRILLGTETTPALIRAAHAVHAAIPGAELRELPGHGHAAMDADPEMFAAEVVDWLLPAG